MSKKQSSVDGLVRQTKPFPASPDAKSEVGSDDKTMVVGVGMRQSELTRLSAIAAENGVTRNNLVAYALRRFIGKYDAGTLRIAKGATTTEK